MNTPLDTALDAIEMPKKLEKDKAVEKPSGGLEVELDEPDHEAASPRLPRKTKTRQASFLKSDTDTGNVSQIFSDIEDEVWALSTFSTSFRSFIHST